jgi:hypothetical protein
MKKNFFMDKLYFKLLQYKNKLEAEGKSFWVENQQDYMKLLDYEISIEDHFAWERKHQYFLLISNFIDKKINIDEYMIGLFNLDHEIKNRVKELKSNIPMLKEFKPNSVPEEFSDLILYIMLIWCLSRFRV